MFGHAPISATPFASLGVQPIPPIAVSGIVSSAVYGSPTLSTGPVTVQPSGFSTTAYGSPAIVPGAVDITTIAIAPSSVYGSPAIVPGPVDLALTGILTTAYGQAAITTGPVSISPNGLSSSLAIGSPAIVPGAVDIAPVGLSATAAYGSPALLVGPVSIVTTGISTTAAYGSPALIYLISAKSFGPFVVTGSPALAGDATLSFNPEYQPRRAFPAISTVVDAPRARPFKNSESEILYFGSVVAWKGASGAGNARELAQKPTATNIYDLAGIVAGAGYEGTNVAASDYGQLYVGGMCQVRVLGHASLTAGSVLEAVAGQYYLQYVSSPTQANQFVIHEDHTSAGTEALKMVNVKIAL